MTVADLTFGRDPFSVENQRQSKILQLGLTLFALFVLLVIGYSMQSLRAEQDAVVALNQIGDLQPHLKLNALRKLAQYDEPMSRQNTLYDEFHQKIGEMRQINSRVNATLEAALNACSKAVLPLVMPHSDCIVSGTSSTTEPPPSSMPANAGTLSDASDKVVAASSTASGAVQSAALTGEEGDFCTEDASGNLRLPRSFSSYPAWMKKVLADAMGDYCFQLKVVSPDGAAISADQAMNQLTLISDIKDKVSLRVSWILPFLYGLLGSAIFAMRNVASVRTPAMEFLPIVMRLSLGGVAGIVIGWFSSAAMPGLEATNTISVPFALAFLTGYGIDLLFTMLDRFNHAIGERPRDK